MNKAYEVNLNTKKSIQTMFNFSKKDECDFYKDEKFETTSSLLAIKQFTGLDVFAKFRHSPESILDGLVECKTLKEAQLIKEKISNLEISTYILSFKDQKIYLCFPAINIERNANELNNRLQRFCSANTELSSKLNK